MIEPILKACHPTTPKGHGRVELRRVLNGIIFRLRIGCQWNKLPGCRGDGRTVHCHCQQWCQRGIGARPWTVLLETCDGWAGWAGGGRLPTPLWAMLVAAYQDIPPMRRIGADKFDP